MSTLIELSNGKQVYTQQSWQSREAYNFVVSRLGKWLPWDPRGWPDEVKDAGCRCNNHSFVALNQDDEDCDIWVCSECRKPKPLMFYVEWCCDCGTPYVIKRFPDTLLLCGECGG